MQRRTAGVIFICISAFLYGIRYLSAAIFGSNISSWDISLFRIMLHSVGNGPVILSWLALITGVGYLIFAEFESTITRNMKDIKDNWNDFDTRNHDDNNKEQ